MSEDDLNTLLGELADKVHHAVDEAVEAGVPEETAVRHLATLSNAWLSEDPGIPMYRMRKD